uniref:Uncharacterized protein n=1 Tax=Oryza sativa subsp. japonica TaxID=39947 RepID=Q5Z6L9_ORYSJ|nr:hypothetical protein [Oryza sativa Japonica Group]
MQQVVGGGAGARCVRATTAPRELAACTTELQLRCSIHPPMVTRCKDWDGRQKHAKVIARFSELSSAVVQRGGATPLLADFGSGEFGGVVAWRGGAIPPPLRSPPNASPLGPPSVSLPLLGGWWEKAKG